MLPSLRHRLVSISSEYLLNRSFCSSVIRSTTNTNNNNKIELLKLEEVEKILNDVRADDVKVIPVINSKNSESEFTNFIVIATGKSQWHVRNIAQALIYKVIFPILHHQHWITAMLNLQTSVFSLFDSGTTLVLKEIEYLLQGFITYLPVFLDKIQYWARSGRQPEIIKVVVQMATWAPKQSGSLGDCGVWTCMHIESLAAGRFLVCDTNTEKTAMSYLSLLICDPNTAHAAMAYRKRMAM